MRNSFSKGFIGAALVLALVLVILPQSGVAAPPALVGMGDSIGEGVQANDAAWQTQPFSYVNWINFQLGGDLKLPFIQTNLFGATQQTDNRRRVFPDDIGTNVSVSGANVADLLNSRADAASVAAINDELDLVMYPRVQSQMEYVESSLPALILCWIGSNDVLAAVTSYDNLDASQMTTLAEFDLNYTELADRLQAMKTNHGSKVVLANIPNVTDIGFLVDRLAAEAITGFPVALPDGYYTTTLAAVLMNLQGNDSMVSDPAFVLDPGELASIVSRLQEFNAVIAREASRIGVPVVDINTRFSQLVANPPLLLGRPLTKDILGGLFSNDGVHPSNIGHGLVANEFIAVLNQAYGMNLSPLTPQVMGYLYLTDPSIDKDNDGKATGRLGVGLIESIYFLIGLTGDSDDFTPN